MRTIINTVLLFVFFVTTANSQSLAKLDQKNGFKTLKLGSNRAGFGNNLMDMGIVGGAKCFIYSGDDKNLQEVFDVSLPVVELFFDKADKLVGIKLSKENSNTTPAQSNKMLRDYQSLIDKFTLLYGKPTNNEDKSGSPQILGDAWVANNVILKVVGTNYGIGETTQIEVMVFNRPFLINKEKEKLEKGF